MQNLKPITLNFTETAQTYTINFPENFEKLANDLMKQIGQRNLIFITDENVFQKSPFFQKSNKERDGICPMMKKYTLVLPAGEEFKTWDSIERILEKSFELALDRSSVMIAVGGGVIGDMTGFASSIFMRGIPFIQVPSTLLSMVDSSVGGKTGIDSKFGKNLIGAFHQPETVFCCEKFLETLPETEVKNGLGEMIKHGIIHETEKNPHLKNLEKISTKFQKKLPKSLLKDSQILSEIFSLVPDSLQIKKYIVEKDVRESGIRGFLNLGHTFGHAIEHLSNFKIPHGQAVCMGIIKAIEYSEKYKLSEDPELLKRIKKILENFQIDIDHGFSDEKIIPAMIHDKKKKNGQIRLILPKSMGNLVYEDLRI